MMLRNSLRLIAVGAVALVISAGGAFSQAPAPHADHPAPSIRPAQPPSAQGQGMPMMGNMGEMMRMMRDMMPMMERMGAASPEERARMMERMRPMMREMMPMMERMSGAAPSAGTHDHGVQAGAAPSTREFADAAQRMHRDMAIAYTGDADIDFVRGMIPHHQGAIDMAEIVLRHGKNETARKWAVDIIREQRREIEEMRAWLRANAR
ncbi:MAG: DUF305 domain-containing protein [Magnetospirillum sp.]|nr:DUF305 domain-containing protein [Magnetospirillum sp.]